MRTRLARIVTVGVATYVVAALVLFAAQRQLIFPGQRIRIRDQPLPSVPGLTAMRIPTSVGDTEAWYLPPLNHNTEPTATILFAHGNGEVIDDWPTRWDEFRVLGLGILLVEYPGYGRADGSPSESSIREAMTSAYDALTLVPSVDATRIIGYGQSLGGGAIGQLAATRPLCALILQSTFTSLRIFARNAWMPAFLVRDPFDTLAVVQRYSGPMLVMHGRQDTLIPFHEAEILAAAGRAADIELYDGGHNGWTPYMTGRVRSFLTRQGVISGASTD